MVAIGSAGSREPTRRRTWYRSRCLPPPRIFSSARPQRSLPAPSSLQKETVSGLMHPNSQAMNCAILFLSSAISVRTSRETRRRMLLHAVWACAFLSCS